MPFAAFLVAMVGPLAAQLLLSFGVSAVVFTGATAALSTLRGMVLTNVNALPVQVVQFLGLIGVWESLGIMFGAATFALAWGAAGRSIRIVRPA